MDNPQLTVQCVGALVVFVAARLCHQAFVKSIEVWYSSPANRHLYFKAFKEQYQQTGKADFSAFMKTHPETISQTFGDEATSEGQMVKAMVAPSAIIMAIGGIMMRCGGNSMWGYVFHAFRGLMTPFGLLMVLQTPVVSGAGAGNKEIREGKKVSNIELLYQLNWVILHFVGFAAFLGPAVIIELPVAVYELLTHEGSGSGFHVEAARMGLAAMRIICAVLLVISAPFLARDSTKNPNSLGALKWRAEFTVGEFGACQMYFNALSVWIQPGTSYGWADLVLLALLALEAFRIFFAHGVFWLVTMMKWDSIDWANVMKYEIPAQGPLMKALRQKTGNELIHLHAVQAGVPDFTESIVKASTYLPASSVATGCKYDKLRLLVFKPDNYENFKAMDFPDLSEMDLDHWNGDFTRVLATLPTADTLFFPFGTYKLDMMIPMVLVSMTDYSGDIAKLGEVAANNLPAKAGTEEVGYDITSKVLSDPRGAFLAQQSFSEAIQAKGKTAGFYKLISEIGDLIDKADAAKAGDAGAPLLSKTPQGYEIQLRGALKASPKVVLRAHQTQLLPAGWESLPKVDPMPSSAT